MQTYSELEETLSLAKQSNFSIGVELIPAIPDYITAQNETLYTEYANTINNFTSLILYNYESNGFQTLKLLEGKQSKWKLSPDNTTFKENHTIME